MGTETDVGNIDFELQAKRGYKFLCFTLAEFRSVVEDTKSNTKNFTKSISIHSDYQSVHFW